MRILTLWLLCATAIGCGSTRIHVINDLDGSPVANATVYPQVNDFWGSPTVRRSVTTNADGDAIVPYAHVFHATASHAGLRPFYPDHSRWRETEGTYLILMRPPQPTVLVLPSSFEGPVLIADRARRDDERMPLLEVQRETDPGVPTRVPIDDLCALSELTARSGDVPITRSRMREAQPDARYLWHANAADVSYGDDGSVEVFYVGRAETAERFETALGQALAKNDIGIGGKLSRAKWQDLLQQFLKP